ncbi:MAG: site-specific DNA-methyltransferase [Candidatus Heimdallarchaeota archaeon]|nr:MAG: site-specific DNA-methyltransferase [Candidatus Heimdallarchaeota archaeon]
MIHASSMTEIKHLEDNHPEDTNKLILLGSKINILENLKSFFKSLNPRLIFLDLSMYYQPTKIELVEDIKEIVMERREEYSKLPEKKEINNEFWRKTQQLLDRCKLVLHEEGFIAIKVNGTIKSGLKSRMDVIFGSDRFVNEIIIDSPYKVWYTPNSTVFERTNFILLYSQNLNPRINPVLNEKESGGYWHSFVSKGQGNPKKFIFEDIGEIILTPPPGTHWKLKQEAILDLCTKGQIRLNRKGNPEYWVPQKKGQIIDSNWLDICSYQWVNKYFTSSSDFYTRLLRMCLNEQELFLDLSTNLGMSLIIAEQLRLKWIGLEEDQYAFKLIMELLKDKGTFFSAYNCESLPDFPLSLYPKNDAIDTVNDFSSTNRFSLKLIERYLGQISSSNKEKSDEWANMLILGDVFEVLPCLNQKIQKKLKIIYIDPPFFTGANEKIIIPIGLSEGQEFNAGENIVFPIEDLAYKNVIEVPDPIEFFKQWFKKRIQPMRSLLQDDGLIFVRFDYHFGHYARMVLDEVFGSQNFVNEFLVRRMKKNLSLKQAYNQTHLIVHSDSVFAYQNSESAQLKSSTIKKKRRKNQDTAEIQYSSDNLWIDIAGYEKLKKTLYPTENSEALLTRIIEISTEKGDIIADFFCGSGTALAVAEKLGRMWVGVDIGKYSIHEVRKRLLKIPNNMPFEILNTIDSSDSLSPSHTPKGEMTNPMVRLETKVVGRKLKITIVAFSLSKPIDIRITHDFINFIDFWAIDWDHQNGQFEAKWYSYREMRGKKVLRNVQASITHEYSNPGKYLVVVTVYDVLGYSTRQSFTVTIINEE